jgi:signal transduction histidine kinase
MESTPEHVSSSQDLHARAENAREQARALAVHNRDLVSHVRSSRQRLSRLTLELTNACAEVSRQHVLERREDIALTLAASVSHELRTPLAAIVGWLRILEQTQESALREKALRNIHTSADRQQRLIEDLLDVARLRSGKLSLSLARFPADVVVLATVEALQPTLTDKAHALQMLLEPGLEIVGDASRIQQVVENLIRNAIKFTPGGGRIEVELRGAREHVQITVCDNGQGIDHAFLPHIFESYRQANHAELRAGGGVGLGLAISKQIVQLHGGTIDAHSDGLGRGACINVLLPRSGPSASP